MYESSIGLGFLCGPLIVAGLNSIGGNLLTFYAMGGLGLVLLPLVLHIAKLVEQAEQLQKSNTAKFMASFPDNNAAKNSAKNDDIQSENS